MDGAKRPKLDLSWVDDADGSHFPIQNLPFGIFSHAARGLDPRPGVAIGDSVLDLRQAAVEGLLDELTFHAPSVFGDDSLNDFMARPRADWQAVRARLTGLLGRDAADASLRERPDRQSRCLVPRAEVQMHLPAKVGDYTDFYSSREHASNVGEMFRGKGNELMPNWLHLPVGYHGRASSVVVSGTPVVRPKGQLQLDKADPTKGTEHAPCRLLDFELEMVTNPHPSPNPNPNPNSNPDPNPNPSRSPSRSPSPNPHPTPNPRGSLWAVTRRRSARR